MKTLEESYDVSVRLLVTMEQNSHFHHWLKGETLMWVAFWFDLFKNIWTQKDSH